MSNMQELSKLYDLTDLLIDKASKDDLAETAKLLAVNLSHYQMKYGELPLDETMALFDTDKPNDAQTEMLANGMKNLIGLLGNVVMGLDEPRH